MDNLNIADIIKSAFDGKPADVATAFNSAIQSKMADAIELKRQEISQNMYGDTDEGEDENLDDDVEVDADEDDTDLYNLDVEDQPDEDV